MEERRILDLAGGAHAAAALTMRTTILQIHRMIVSFKLFQLGFVIFVGSYLPPWAEAVTTNPPSIGEIEKLATAQHWDEIVRLLERVNSRTADMDFYYGDSLARLQRWPEAETAFKAGWQLAPADPRFAVELAGIAFGEKRYSQAAFRLRQAVKLMPNDQYANDFLGTVYFLEGNLEASLKYWNRAGKPEIAEVEEDPRYRISPSLFDHAFAFSPAAKMQLSQFLDTEQRIRALGVFRQYHIDLIAREDGEFNAVFQGEERNGFGNTRAEALAMLLRGLPFQSLNTEFYNLRREAVNLDLLYRWDTQKRRILLDLSGPFEQSAKHRYRVATDLRDENWALRASSVGLAPALASMNMRREQFAFDLATFTSERLRWSAGAELSHRDFRSVAPGSILTPALLAKGYQLKQRAALGGMLLRVPEHRLTLDADSSSQIARLWSRPAKSFEKLQASMVCRWFPRAEGDDFETSQKLRAGKTFGMSPFDELAMLGLERDNDLPMRAHIGTRDGQKGSAPLGRNYLLASTETDKNLYSIGVMTIRAGPFLDIGRISNPSSMPGSGLWLHDTGAQVKLRILGSGFVFSWGRDLRSANNAFYVTILQ